MNFQEFKNAVIAKATAMGIEEYELYYQAAESTSVSAFQHAINQLDNPMRMKAVKRDIAKISTVIKENEMK